MKLAAVALIIATSTSIARAEDTSELPRDPDTALYLSIVGTVAGATLLVPVGGMKNEDWKVGLPMFALAELLPSAGHVYAGNYVSAGLVTRLLGGTMIVIALKDPFESDQIVSSNARALGVTGILLTLGGTVYDIATARRSARRYNERQLKLSPVIATDTGVAPGFGVSAAF
jgi:hypothetical protein